MLTSTKCSLSTIRLVRWLLVLSMLVAPRSVSAQITTELDRALTDFKTTIFDESLPETDRVAAMRSYRQAVDNANDTAKPVAFDRMARLVLKVVRDKSLPITLRTTAALSYPHGMRDFSEVESAIIAGVNGSNSTVVRIEAIQWFRNGLGGQALSAVAKALSDEEPSVVLAAIDTISENLTIDQNVLLQLQDLYLTHPDRLVATKALVAIGKSPDTWSDQPLEPRLIEWLNDHEVVEPRSLGEAISHLLQKKKLSAEKLAPPLQDFIEKHNRRHDVSGMIKALGLCGSHAKMAVPMLRDMAREPERFNSLDEHLCTLHSLGTLGRFAQEAERELVRWLDVDPSRQQAALALARMGVAEERVLPLANQWLDDGTPSDRRVAIQIIVHYGPKAEPCVGSLVRALDDPFLTRSTLFATARVGPPAHPAIQKIKSFVRNRRHVFESIQALIAVDGIDGPAVNESLAHVKLTSDDAEKVLRLIGPKKSLTLLKSAANDGSAVERSNAVGLAVKCLKRDQALSLLKSLLGDEDPSVRVKAAKEFTRFEPTSETALRVLADDDLCKGWNARTANVFEQAGRKGKSILVKALIDPDGDRRSKRTIVEMFRRLKFLSSCHAERETLAGASNDQNLDVLTRQWATIGLRSLCEYERVDDVSIDLLVMSIQGDDVELRDAAIDACAGLMMTARGEPRQELCDPMIQLLIDSPRDLSILNVTGKFRDVRLPESYAPKIIELWESRPFIASELIRLTRFRHQDLVPVFMKSIGSVKRGRQAFNSLAFQGSSAVEPLIQWAADKKKDQWTRLRAFDCLEKLPAGNEVQIVKLREIVKTDPSLAGFWAARVLERWGQADKVALERILATVLADEQNAWTVYRGPKRIPPKLRDFFAQRLRDEMMAHQTSDVLPKGLNHNIDWIVDFVLQHDPDTAGNIATIVNLIDDESRKDQLIERLFSHRDRSIDRLIDRSQLNPAAILILLKWQLEECDDGSFEKILHQNLAFSRFLSDNLSSDDDDIRWQATKLAAALGIETESVLQNTAWQLRSSEVPLFEVGELIEQLGEKAGPLAPLVLRVYADEQDPLNAPSLVCHCGAPGKVVIPQLLDALNDHRRKTEAYHCLATLGVHAHGAVETLLPRLDDPLHCELAAMAMGKIAPNDARIADRLLNNFERPEMRFPVIRAIGASGEAAAPAVDLLIQQLGTEDIELKMAVIRSLTTLGPVAAPATGSLIGLAQHDDPYVREAVIGALGRIGGSDEKKMSVFTRALSDADRGVAFGAVELLGDKGAEAAPAVGALIERLLAAKSRREINTLIDTLTSIGPVAKPALGELRKKLQTRQATNPDSIFVEDVVDAIRQIEECE